MSLPSYFKGSVGVSERPTIPKSVSERPTIPKSVSERPTIPSYFTPIREIQSYNYREIQKYVSTENDKTEYIPNLSVGEKALLCQRYFQSRMFGTSHVFVQRLLESLQCRGNICVPLIHTWLNKVQIDNLVIIHHPEDAERICQKHVKKAPVFTSFLHNSIISTTDNEDWKRQRGEMNMAFIPKLSLQRVFPKSMERAKNCAKLLRDASQKRESVNMSEFFLNETQAQLQLSMVGFSAEIQIETNQKIRQAFAGINVEYTQEFSEKALAETQRSSGPLSKLFDLRDDPLQNLGNVLIFAFAGHDTTGHTLAWLLYELCRHPKYKRELLSEIDKYWRKHSEPTYDTFKELPFMTRCITETLRLWPALANGTYRELETDEQIRGIDGTPVTVPKGTYCQILNWTRHRSKDLWGDTANTFDPYREFRDSEIWDHAGFGTTNVSSDRFSPFTYGPRNCIGKNFSQMEMRLILLYLFRDYDFELSPEQPHEIQGLNTFTMGPKSHKDDEMMGVYVSVISRNSKL